ncbi:helix-turn-helix domain-containing protein [Orbus sturtevantii]|uniref:winged helix-turn-helix transcriptional regulator n=1 Tax=Orbus sturtevantii TaxID=3074109 RepID=UPI00370D0007
MKKENGKYLLCPMAKLQKIIAGKWKVYILWILAHQTIRYGELHRELAGITQSMLTKQLRELEQDGFIVRHIYPEVPPKVEYALSDLGKTFIPILKDLNQWGQTHLK